MIRADTAAQAQAQLLQILRKLAKKQTPPIDLRNTEIGMVKAFGDKYGEVTVALNFESRIDQLINLLSDVTAQKEIIGVNDMRIGGAHPKEKTMPVRLTISGLVRRELVPDKKGQWLFMRRNLWFLDLILLISVVITGFVLKQRWSETSARESALFKQAVPVPAAPALPAIPRVNPATPATYMAAVQMNLFSKDRNPNVILDPPPPPPPPPQMPPLPVAYGVMDLGGGADSDPRGEARGFAQRLPAG